MSLNIKNPEAERLARELAAATGDTLTGAIMEALQERLARIQHHDTAGKADRLARVFELAADGGRRWLEPFRHAAHGDLLYDERGLPR